MTQYPGKDVLKAIKILYGAEPSACRWFEHAAARQRDARASTIERLMAICDLSRADAVTLARQLEESGCAEFLVGRRGSPSRLEWRYSLISLGQAASGESDDLEEVDREADELEQEGLADRSKTAPVSPTPSAGTAITIPEAKSGLAITFGVPVSAIEITIRI